MAGNLANVASGEGERSPLCVNAPDGDLASDARHRTVVHSRLFAPSRPRALEFDERLTDKRAGYDALTHQQLTSSLELSTSSNEFISIEGSDVTTQALELCEKWALKHYRRVLMALGWIPPQGECFSPHARRALHIVLIFFWIIVIIGAFIAQILSCFRRDKFLAFHDADTWHIYNESCKDLNDNANTSDLVPVDHEGSATCRTLYCDHHHLFTDYILFDLLLLTVYVYGVYLFRSEDGGDLSYLHNLASRAFVMTSLASQGSSEKSSNRRLLLSIMSFCLAGVVWIFLSLIVRILTIYSAHIFDSTVAIRWHNEIFFGSEKVSLVAFSLVGFLFFDMVYIAAAVNHAVQSELLVWLLSSVTTLLYKNEYHDVDAAIKDILECRRYLRTLNGRASTSVALIIFIVGNMSVLAVLTLNQITDDDDDDSYNIAVAMMNILAWVALVSLPIIQATRVTRTCLLLKDAVTVIRSRPQLYVDTPQLDLDSLLLLTQSIRLRATLFGVPMSPSLVYGVVALTAFIVILLSQTNIYFLSII